MQEYHRTKVKNANNIHPPVHQSNQPLRQKMTLLMISSSPRFTVRPTGTITSRHLPHVPIRQQVHIMLHHRQLPFLILKMKPSSTTSPSQNSQQRHSKRLKQKYISSLAQLGKHVQYSLYPGTKVCWQRQWFGWQGSNRKASKGCCWGWKETLCHKRRSSLWCSLQKCCWRAEAPGILRQCLPYLCGIRQSSLRGIQLRHSLCEGIQGI